MEIIREIEEEYIINEMKDLGKYLSEFGKEDREYFIVLGLDSRNRVTYREIVGIGTLNTAIIHPREVFKKAVVNSANAIIVAHNHPSNNKEASAEDLKVGRQLKQAGEILGIKVLDCVIITKEGLSSFNERI